MSALKAFDSLIDVVLAIDGDLRLRYGNEPAAEILGASMKRLASGKPLADWLEFAGTDFETRDLINALEATPYQELSFKASNGSIGWAQVSSQRTPDAMLPAGSSPLWLIFVRDVSLEKTLHEKYRAELEQKEIVIRDLINARAQLEDYSKNLEKMVDQRTAELREANRLLSAVLDSLGQGIVVFDRDGKLLPIHSRVASKMFEQDPGGLDVSRLLAQTPQERASFEKWRHALFADLLPFIDMATLGPAAYAHSQGRAIALTYNPMRAVDGSLDAVVMVATDRTNELAAVAEAKRERRYARMVSCIAGNQQQFRAFVSESRKLFAQILDACAAANKGTQDDIALWLHTLKGGAASFALDVLADAAHECEAHIDERLRMAPLVEGMRVTFDEIIKEQSALFGGMPDGGGRTAEIPIQRLRAWSAVLEEVSIGELQKGSLAAIRLDIENDYLRAPIEFSFRHFNVSMGDLASSLGKSLKPIQIEGGEIAIIPEKWSELFASLVHAFRNAVDHGIESPAERISAGKDEAGQLTVRFTQRFSKDRKWLKIEITDDGRGIDPKRIREKLASGSSGAALVASTDSELIQAVFMKNLSTAETAGKISGRGVGLSALLAVAKAMGGMARVASEIGKGSTLTIDIPYND